MSFRGVVRQSKFRHVFGQALKRDLCYDNIRISKHSKDITFCAVNPKYVAFVTEAAGGGSFLVIPLEKTGRIEPDTPFVDAHKGSVLDIKWCPHDDDVIASSSEDCTIKVWRIPEGGLRSNLEECECHLIYHQKSVSHIEWHPSAQFVLLSADSEQILIWDVGTGEVLVEIDTTYLNAQVWGCCWNENGSRILAPFNDKKVRVFDARSGEVLLESFAHEAKKNTQAIFVGNKILTTGFSRQSERQIALWDENMKNIVVQEVDNANGVLFPHYDPDTGMLYLCAKGDCSIRYYEITDQAPYIHIVNNFVSSEPQRGLGLMPKRGLNVNNCEIARLYKVHSKGLCEVIPMTVPRKSEMFQDDLYPDTAGPEPAMTAEEWIHGKDAYPIKISLREGYIPSERTVAKKAMLKPRVKAGGMTKAAGPANRAQQSNNRSSTGASTTQQQPLQQQAVSNAHHQQQLQATPQQQIAPANIPASDEVQCMMDDIRKLKIIVKGHEKRINSLEEKLRHYEEENNTNEDSQ